MEPLRVLIADDHPLFRHGLRALLGATPGFEVVGEASTGEEAIELAASLEPDVILIDLQMPGINGVEATRRILQADSSARILVVTMFQDDASVFTAMRAGARGYVLKDADKDDILRAIRAVATGEAIFSPAIATRLLGYFGSEHASVPRQAFPALTQREREVLALLAQGTTNREIARKLDLSPKTVSNYVSTILNKLQVADRAQAILRARGESLRGDQAGLE